MGSKKKPTATPTTSSRGALEKAVLPDHTGDQERNERHADEDRGGTSSPGAVDKAAKKPERAVGAKGGAEVDRANAPAAARPAKKSSIAAPPEDSRAAEVHAVLAPFGFPKGPGKGLGFTPADDALFVRGYPNLRFLTEEEVEPNAAIKAVEAALDAIDPAFRIAVPREIARRFLLGYRVGPLLFVGAQSAVKNVTKRKERLAAVESDQAIDVTLLEETLEAHGWGMGTDTYSRWRWPKVLYLYEAFIGTEPVARALVKHLVRSAEDLPRWGSIGQDPQRANAVHHYLAAALPWLFMRLPKKVVAELRATLGATIARADATSAKKSVYSSMLRWLSAPDAHPVPEGLALETVSGTGLSDSLDRHEHAFLWTVGRVVWLLGTSRLASRLRVSGYDLPRMVDTISPIRDPGVVRLMVHIASQRNGKKAACDWLVAHADYARPIVEALAQKGDEKEKKVALAALDAMRSEEVLDPEVLDERALEAEIKSIFTKLGGKLQAAGEGPAASTAILEAFEAYTEARAAAGDPIPDAYFTHRFGDFGLGAWAMLAVDVI